MSEDRLHVPGPGLVRAGNGPRHRRGRARGDGRVRGGQRGLRPRPQAALLRRHRRGADAHRPAAAGARRHEPRDQRGPAGPRHRAATTSSATRSASSRRSARRTRSSVAEAIGLVRERGLAMAAAAKAHPGSMAAILGLADEVVEALCRKIANVWPANYNCPGQLVISGETDAVDECCVGGASARAPGARSACASRARSTRRSSSSQPSGCARRSTGSTSRRRRRISSPR